MVRISLLCYFHIRCITVFRNYLVKCDFTSLFLIVFCSLSNRMKYK
uniref:Uncharacterized protein n=1 Tax=Caudovirales sp. ctEpl1 TaxID=2826770 RepID=A0A8S5NRU9_9CAUD|nr:MAG TPA: hypothetical protein [Caudovirales sp. ctEpl1]